MANLLDVNVLIALIDPSHVAHDPAHAWFAAGGSVAWATSPLTENGLVRIVSHPRYPNAVGSTAVAIDLLRSLRAHPGHRFWPDDLSLTDEGVVEPKHPVTSAKLTDAYLLALAINNGGVLVTFDRGLSSLANPAKRPFLLVLDASA